LLCFYKRAQEVKTEFEDTVEEIITVPYATKEIAWYVKGIARRLTG